MPRYAKRKTSSRTSGKTNVRSRSRSSTTRRTSRRKYSKKVSSKWPIWKNPLPQQSLFKLTYQDSRFNLSTATLGNYRAYRVWRGNDLYDPDYTGIGVQPYGYDQLCSGTSLYGKYLVYASKITIYPHVYSATSGTAGQFSLRLALFPMSESMVSYDEFDDIARIPYCKRRVIESANDTKNIMKCYASTAKILPDAKDLSGGYYSAAYNADPINAWYWLLYVDATEFQNDTSTYFDCKITYYCKLIKTNNINES